MIWHPLSISILILDGLTILLLCLSCPVLVQILTQWDGDSSSASQLRLESQFEMVAFQNTLGFGFNLFASLLCILAIASVFPKVVPGAMCGTGVMEAFGVLGPKIIILRLLTLVLFFSFFRIKTHAFQSPIAKLQKHTARILLLLVPFVLLASWNTMLGLKNLNTLQPVDCCSALLTQTSQSISLAWMDTLLSHLNPLMAVFFLAGPWLLKNHRIWIVVLYSFWLISLPIFLMADVLPYIYGVLGHACLWCSFKTQYLGLGYIFLSAVLYLGGVSISWAMESRFSTQNSPWTTLFRKLILGLGLFYLMALFPIFHWFVKTGNWITG